MAIQRVLASRVAAGPVASSVGVPRVSLSRPSTPDLPPAIRNFGAKPRFRIDETIAEQYPLPPKTGGVQDTPKQTGDIPKPEAAPDQPYVDQGQVPYEEEQDEIEEEEATYEGEKTFPVAASHVRDGCVCTVAYCRTNAGTYEPVVSKVRVPGPSNMHGPVDFGADIQSPSLNVALAKSAQLLTQKAQSLTQREIARQLVNRAREGDQNAAAIIVVARENAAKGNPKAQEAIRLIREYIDKNPMSDVGAEVKTDRTHPRNWAAVWLANGPALSNGRIREFMAGFGSDEEAEAFLYAARNWQDDDMAGDDSGIVDMGRAVGYARAIQKVRMPGSRISEFCPAAGWEFGE